MLADVWIFLGTSVEKGRKTALACLREGYPLDILEGLKDLKSISQNVLVGFFFFDSTNKEKERERKLNPANPAPSSDFSQVSLFHFKLKSH